MIPKTTCECDVLDRKDSNGVEWSRLVGWLAGLVRSVPVCYLGMYCTYIPI